MNKPYFDKNMTLYIKGVMLILMYILHFFCFPDWYVDGISYPALGFLSGMQGHFQICVAGFSFLTGYFYCFLKEKNFRYSVKKIIGILIPYWIVYILFLIVSLVLGTADITVKSFLLEISAVKPTVMSFCWYVSFYILSMLMLPVLKLVSFGSKAAFCALGVFGPVFLYYAVTHFFPNDILISLLDKYQVYFPIIIIGYMSAEFGIFERISLLLGKRKAVIIPVSLAMVIIVFFEPGWLYSLPFDGFAFSAFRKLIRIVSIPLFVFGLIELFGMIKEKYLIPLKMIGKYSLLMWFLHGIFFGGNKEVLQRILFSPRNPLLVLLWGLLINFAAAFLINLVSERAVKAATKKLS
ncbi:MAG: acyltransferase [Clostridiales bacterium]|nr:acyltransferase [Clostridiales bacterium]